MLANVPVASSLGLLLSSLLAFQAVGAVGGNVDQWLHASEAKLAARAGTSAATQPAPAGPHHVMRAPDGMFYLTAEANAAPVRFLIDTGSTTTILTRSDAERLGIEALPDESRRSARTLAGEVHISQAVL
jgi:predicted aspartyl protease